MRWRWPCRKVEGWDVSRALTEIAPLLVEEAEVPGKEFGELVRDRKRRFHLPIQQWDKVAPGRPVEAQADQPDPAELDQEPAGHFERAWWHLELAERRMREVLALLDQARQLRVSPERLAELEAAYQQEVLARDAALAVFEQDNAGNASAMLAPPDGAQHGASLSRGSSS